MIHGPFVLPDSSYIVGDNCFMRFRNPAELMRSLAIWKDWGIEPKVDKQMMMIVISSAAADLTLITPKRN